VPGVLIPGRQWENSPLLRSERGSFLAKKSTPPESPCVKLDSLGFLQKSVEIFLDDPVDRGSRIQINYFEVSFHNTMYAPTKPDSTILRSPSEIQRTSASRSALHCISASRMEDRGSRRNCTGDPTSARRKASVLSQTSTPNPNNCFAMIAPNDAFPCHSAGNNALVHLGCSPADKKEGRTQIR
jgi:hypothetical protein